MGISAVVNGNYSTRIQLQLGSLTGPLSSSALGAFDPRRDLDIYVDGAPMKILSFTFVVASNQYFMFTAHSFSPTAIVQVIHHMPVGPFTASNGSVPGFALIASVATGFDTLTPAIGISTAPTLTNQTVPVIWSAAAVPQVRIVCSAAGFDTGVFPVLSAAGVVYMPPFTAEGTYPVTITAYDLSGTLLSAPAAITVNSVITAS